MIPTRIDRYIFRLLLLALTFVVVALMFAVWLSQSLRFLEMAVVGGAPVGAYLALVTLTLPGFLAIILPLSLLAATVFVYNKLTSDSELIVMRAAGMSPLRLAKPALMLATLVALVVMVLNFWVAPLGMRRFELDKIAASSKLTAIPVKVGAFTVLGDNLTVFARDRERGGRFTGLMLHDSRDKAKPVTIIARSGEMVAAPEGPKLLVTDGVRQEKDPKTGALTELAFQSYTVDLALFGKPSYARWPEARERAMGDLLHPDLSNRRDRENLNRFFGEAHSRVTAPWAAVGLTLMALAIFLNGEFNRRGQFKRIFAIVLLATLFQGLALGATNLAMTRPFATPLMYIVVMLPVLLGLWWLQRENRKPIPAKPEAAP